MKKLYRYQLDCGRMGELDGLFIATDQEVQDALGHRIYWGEVLGKHSEIYEDLRRDQLKVVSDDQDFIEKLAALLGTSVSGFNPIDRYQEQLGDGDYGDEE